MAAHFFRNLFIGETDSPNFSASWNGEDRRTGRDQRFNVDRRSVLNSWRNSELTGRRDHKDRRMGLDRRHL